MIEYQNNRFITKPDKRKERRIVSHRTGGGLFITPNY